MSYYSDTYLDKSLFPKKQTTTLFKLLNHPENISLSHIVTIHCRWTYNSVSRRSSTSNPWNWKKKYLPVLVSCNKLPTVNAFCNRNWWFSCHFWIYRLNSGHIWSECIIHVCTKRWLQYDIILPINQLQQWNYESHTYCLMIYKYRVETYVYTLNWLQIFILSWKLWFVDPFYVVLLLFCLMSLQ